MLMFVVYFRMIGKKVLHMNAPMLHIFELQIKIQELPYIKDNLATS